MLIASSNNIINSLLLNPLIGEEVDANGEVSNGTAILTPPDANKRPREATPGSASKRHSPMKGGSDKS